MNCLRAFALDSSPQGQMNRLKNVTTDSKNARILKTAFTTDGNKLVVLN
jgi:hypothetical protein